MDDEQVLRGDTLVFRGLKFHGYHGVKPEERTLVKEVVEGEPRNLLESVAHQIVVATLDKFPQISDVCVKVGKPHVSVQGQLDCLGVKDI
ncbi:Dihydroneopterin aldolase 1-like protein [Drosera capensis]